MKSTLPPLGAIINDENKDHTSRKTSDVSTILDDSSASRGRVKRKCVVEHEKRKSFVENEYDIEIIEPLPVIKKEHVIGRKRGRPPLEKNTYTSYTVSSRLTNVYAQYFKPNLKPEHFYAFMKSYNFPGNIASHENFKTISDNLIRAKTQQPMPQIPQYHENMPMFRNINVIRPEQQIHNVMTGPWQNIPHPNQMSLPEHAFPPQMGNQMINQQDMRQFQQQCPSYISYDAPYTIKPELMINVDPNRIHQIVSTNPVYPQNTDVKVQKDDHQQYMMANYISGNDPSQQNRV